MKRFLVFMLAVLILFTCSACKKETLPAMQSGSAQTAAGGAGADCFRRFRPRSGCAVPAGPHGAGGVNCGQRAASVFRRSRPDRQYVHRQCGRTASDGSSGVLHAGTRLHRAGASRFSGRPCCAGCAGSSLPQRLNDSSMCETVCSWPGHRVSRCFIP